MGTTLCYHRHIRTGAVPASVNRTKPYRQLNHLQDIKNEHPDLRGLLMPMLSSIDFSLERFVCRYLSEFVHSSIHSLRHSCNFTCFDMHLKYSTLASTVEFILSAISM